MPRNNGEKYLFKGNMKDFFTQGKKNRYIANEIGRSEVYVGKILNGKCYCDRLTAFGFVKWFFPEKKIIDFFDRK